MEESKMRKLSTKGKMIAHAIIGFLFGGFLASFIIGLITSQWEIFAIGMAAAGFQFLIFYGAYTIEKHRV